MKILRRMNHIGCNTETIGRADARTLAKAIFVGAANIAA
jgi:hypothetical protein